MALERRREMRDIVRRNLTVSEVREVAPSFVRVTLSGAELEGFVSPGPGDHIKMFFGEEDGRRINRDYTPLHFRETEQGFFLDVDMVTHEHPGPASDWAKEVRVGDEILIAGPRGSKYPPEGIDQAVLIGDETAFPAIRRWLDVLPQDVPKHLLLFSSHDALREYFADRNDIVWCTRQEAPEAIPERLRGITFTETSYAFLAGEANTLVPMRRYLRRELGLDASQVDAQGYWKQGVAEHDHHAPLDPEDP